MKKAFRDLLKSGDGDNAKALFNANEQRCKDLLGRLELEEDEFVDLAISGLPEAFFSFIH